MAKKQEELKLQSSTEKPSATKVKTEALGYGRSWAPEVHMEICQLNIGLSPPAPGSAPGANRTPFRIHSNADNVSTSRSLKPFCRFFKNNHLKQRERETSLFPLLLPCVMPPVFPQ
ncbi:uncharacterized protein LOC134808766 isoform X1 [Pan troglodytes]|uniref:uncharacterized protein LOC134808766 isoform X1 n=1 Tax=Pan troglodytes TaxID=9598 RepID=UPI003013DB47